MQKIAVDQESLLAAAGEPLKFPDRSGAGNIDVGGGETREERYRRERAESIRPWQWTALAQWGHDTSNIDYRSIKFLGSIADQLIRKKRLSTKQIKWCCSILDTAVRLGVDPEGL